ncbi:hypothetical protein P152DRAFT_162825 [Eremomyces bilateralis CBS 781.70]|uniref:DNA excision repair protein n=1 Tax=Eremomyces bilateralis CBS 781.70 TaxID=1392243 RepID=A0A6G1FUM4_9PEZI|nr:uncharacterized protein P152DRAFT_162825 [Eremomyces bilateralis CBS 781.70]KAF1809398.1 hypothetical protein P152DRAFT_162825 [Eremomyces bilateralis CBS 781.70]
MSAKEFIDDLAYESAAETVDDDHNLEEKTGIVKGRGERVEWSSDDDAEAVYKAFKKRKSDQRKRQAANQKRARASAKGYEESIVGKRKRPVTKDHEGSAKRTQRAYGDESGDEDLGDEALPDYVKSRQTGFNENRERLGEAGLKLPPLYDDIDFSDDERVSSLKERPVFTDVRLSRPNEDHKMMLSGGLIPAPIAKYLRDYQVKGAEFLHESFVYQRGAILGDDMGLGKTIQVIAFLTAAFGKMGDERDAKLMRKIRKVGGDRFYPRVLIVCPGSLMDNWRSELHGWGWWHVYTFHGSTDDKETALQAARSGRAEIVITTYTTYRLNKSAINTVDWDCVIADECHVIKDRRSETTLAMNEVNALCRLGLTGTAIQNNYDELWTLLNWTNPGRFGNVTTWKLCISKPLQLGQAHDATVGQLARARKVAQQLANNLLPRFFLRRMKTLIADQLPKKSDRVVFCPLTEKQADAYENLVDGEIIHHIKQISDPCSCGEPGKLFGWCCGQEIPGKEPPRWQAWVFPAILTLQRAANHLCLLVPSGLDHVEKEKRDVDWLKEALPDEWRRLYRERDNIMNYAREEYCGKWKVLKKLLGFWSSNGDKVLVFSHSVRLLKMLKMLFTATTSYNVSYLDGAMKYAERTQVVNDFNADPQQFVFLISTRAGGVGLNITSANKVVVVDPNWNPSYDLQAQDRAYRIGQTRDVEVFRLVSAGTIEEIVYARQIYKQQQANIGYNASAERRYFKGVQNMTEKRGEIFGLQNLFAYQGDSVVLQDIVNKTNIAESKAGVAIVDINTDMTQDDPEGGDNDDLHIKEEAAAMNELAESIKIGDGPAPKGKIKSGKGLASKKKNADPIQAILAGAGVEYTHENSEVIGSSKTEKKLSRRAVEQELDPTLMSKAVFESQTGTSSGKTSFETGPEGTPVKGFDPRYLPQKYQPPEDVRRRQFCSMAKEFGLDATQFALTVEGWTQAQRRNCLERFYKIRRQRLANPDAVLAEVPLDTLKTEVKDESETDSGEELL